MIGQSVGNYRIIELLGEGGMGAVYLAEHPGIGRKAAVKVLHPAYAAEQEFVGRFFNEARAANATRHPGIVEIFDFGTLPSGASYIIMELLEGESLATRMRRTGHTDVDTAVDITWQAASALGAAHAKGIVHRDLKPDNMFLVPDLQNPGRFVVKLLDFGIAKLSARNQMGGVGGGSSGSMRTRTGAVMGTPVYMSPEQCRGTKEVDHRTDLYALGIILYELLCGTTPFVSEGFGEMAFLHISAPPPPPRSKNPQIPPRLEQIILKMLEKEPADRLQTAADVQQALRPTTGRPSAPFAAPFDGGPSTQPRQSGAQARSPSQSGLGGAQAGGTRRLPQPNTTFTVATGAMETERLTRTKRGWVLPVALVGAAAIGVGLFVLRPWAAPGDDSRASTGNESKTTAPAAEPPARAPEPRTVGVAIDSTPPGARLVRVRDGAILGTTPFKETWPASDGTEKLRLEKEGFRPESLVVPMDHGLTFSVEMATAPVAEPPSAVAQPPAHVKPGKHHHGSGPPSPTGPAPTPGGVTAPPPPPPKPATPEEPVPL